MPGRRFFCPVQWEQQRDRIRAIGKQQFSQSSITPDLDAGNQRGVRPAGQQRRHDRHRVLNSGVLAGFERFAVGSEPSHPLFGLAELGRRQLVQCPIDRLGVFATQPFIDCRHSLRRGQLEIFAQPVRLQLPIHGGHVAALQLLQSTFDCRQITLLVTRLAFGVWLFALHRQAIQLRRDAYRSGVAPRDEQIYNGVRVAIRTSNE